jgi:hypothetical protein
MPVPVRQNYEHLYLKDSDVSLEITEENGVTFGMILISLSLTALVFLLVLPNIYLDNQIYYESRDIAHYRNIKETLQEEHGIIKSKLEAIHYQENLLKQDIK